MLPISFQQELELLGRVSPFPGDRILGSCLNQASLFARAGPPHALLFLGIGLCQQRVPREEAGRAGKWLLPLGSFATGRALGKGKGGNGRVKPSLVFSSSIAWM